MWDQSPLTSSGQVEALRLLSEWWESSRPVRAPWRRRRATGGLRLQRVPERGDGDNAMHLDLETDAPRAEVARLTAIGARRERPMGQGAWVLQDPAGNRFCVIYPETPGWPQGTKVVAGPTRTGP